MTSTTTKTTGPAQRDSLADHYGHIGISAVASVTTFLARNRDQAVGAKMTKHHLASPADVAS